MVDSPEEQVSDQAPEAAVDTDAQTDSSPEVDMDALRSAIAEAGDDAGLKADILALRRATGHIPGLQQKLSAVERALSDIPSLKQSVARFDALLDALPEGFIPDRQLADLRPRDNSTEAELRAAIAELENRLSPQPAVEAEVDPALAARMAQWEAADAAVTRYAADKKFELSPEDPAWGAALQKFPNDPVSATLDVIKHIDSQIAAKARRDEKADAGSGGNAGRSTRTGTLTFDRLKTMTQAEVAAIPKAERDAITS